MARPSHDVIPSEQIAGRTLDVVLSGLLLVVLAPILGLAVLAIRVASPGPAIFRQTREGLHGRPFTMLKLRTMRLDADAVLERHLAQHPAAREEWERYFRLADDPRIIPGIGRFLRRTSLDELPQLWNVQRGEMSLVGPRPLPAAALAALRPEFRAIRATVRPGVTGLWQVSGRSETDMRQLEELDAEYVRTRSIAVDLKILVRTPSAVLSGRGAY